MGLLDLPFELLLGVAEHLPPIQRSRALPSLCRSMYEVDVMSWSCQIYRTCTFVGRRAKEASVERFLSLQKAVRQAILRNSDSILVTSVYISSVYSIMAHTILAKATELSDGEHKRMQRLLQALTSLSDQATGMMPSERDMGSIIAWKRNLPRPALEYLGHSWRDHDELDRLRIIKTFVEKIIACDVDRSAHKRFGLSAYQEGQVKLLGSVEGVGAELNVQSIS